VLRCLAAGGGPDALRDALRLMRELRDAPGLPPPETDAFNTLMVAAVAAGEPALALDLQQQMVAAGQRLDALTYTTLITVRPAPARPACFP
jgi:pentatricopeptide repeat protein